MGENRTGIRNAVLMIVAAQVGVVWCVHGLGIGKPLDPVSSAGGLAVALLFLSGAMAIAKPMEERPRRLLVAAAIGMTALSAAGGFIAFDGLAALQPESSQ